MFQCGFKTFYRLLFSSRTDSGTKKSKGPTTLVTYHRVLTREACSVFSMTWSHRFVFTLIFIYTVRKQFSTVGVVVEIVKNELKYTKRRNISVFWPWVRITMCTTLSLCAGEAGRPHVRYHRRCCICCPGYGGQGGGGRVREGPAWTFQRTGMTFIPVTFCWRNLWPEFLECCFHFYLG